MHHRPWTSPAPVLAAALIATLLSACGGSNRPDATVSAADDSATLDWRSSALVDVLANDSASRGALSLVSVEAPANGTAVIEGGQLRYTPADGWFGQDSVRYTVQADAGGATAMATLAVTVQARLMLSGTITDAPIADAAVTLRVGDETLEVTADDQGRYSAEVVSADPQAWVQVSGVSTDGRVRLVSVVGELAGVAALADADTGAVNAAALPALDATHWTSAAAALMARANGGEIPETPVELAAARAAVDPQVQLNLATAVRLVADAGVPLPEGIADTLALLLDEAATNAFIEAQPDFATARAEVAAEPQPTQPVALVVDRTRRVMFTVASPMRSGGGIVELNPDGTALVHDWSGTGPGRWTWQNGRLTVTLDSPIVRESFPTWSDPSTGVSRQLRAEYRTLGLRARLIGGDWQVGVAELSFQSEYVFTEGPPTGQPVYGSVDTDQGYPIGLRDIGAGIGIAADELVDGVRIAGLPVGDAVTFTATEFRSDIVRLAADGTARLELSAKDATWTLEDGWLVLTVDGVQRRYTRVSRDASTAVEVWAVSGRFDGSEARMVEAIAGIVDPALAFTQETAARAWRSEALYRASPEAFGSTSFVDLYADGTGSSLFARWSIDADGSIVIFRTGGGVDYPRRWIPIRRTGADWLVLEVVDFGYAAGVVPNVQWRVNWYRDLGPAVR